MSTKTTNYNLIKPEYTDTPDITAMNVNWDTIDTKLKEASESRTTLENHITNKSNPHEVTAEQIGAVTKEYVDEAVASGGSVKTVNNIEPDENGNIQLTVEVPSFSVSGTTLIIGSISLPKPLIAYAVYSADDNSLSFYKTADTITEGSIYRGKTATAVFPDIENNAFEEFNGSIMPYPVWSMYSGQFNRFMNSIIFVDEGISPTSTAKWFSDIRKCTNIIGLNKLNTSNVTDMSEMFAGLNEITSIDISEWDTSNVTNMSNMFGYCEHLTSVGDISNWDTSNVTDMSRMFSVCDDLTFIGDISNWDTGSVTNMSMMFGGCTNLPSVGDISNWDTSNVTDMSRMFLSCINLTADCSRWNVDNVTNHTDFTPNGVNGVIAPVWKN